MPPRKTPKTTPISTPVPATPAPAAAPAPTPAVERSEVKGLGKPKAPAAAPRTPTQEEIARRAYEIYASRGYAPGDQHADWLEAERQLKAGL